MKENKKHTIAAQPLPHQSIYYILYIYIYKKVETF
jgi:hypothetical protein